MMDSGTHRNSTRPGAAVWSSLPQEWAIRQLGTLFQVQQGKALSPSARSGREARPFLRTSNVLWGRIDLTTVDRMTFLPDEAERLSLHNGDLLVCEGGEIGRAALWYGQIPECSYQNHIHRLRSLSQEVHPAFVMYWLQAAFLGFRAYGEIGNKTTIPNLSASRLKALPIPVPPLAEQRAIAHALSQVRAAVVLEEHRVKRLEELMTAAMARVFREGSQGEPRRRTEIGEIPVSWDVVELGSVCTIRSGGTPSRGEVSYWGGPIPWVKTGEIDYRPIESTEETLTPAGLEASSARVFPAGTVLMAMYGQGVTRAKVATLAIDAATNQACAAFFPRACLRAAFLYWYFAFAYNRIRELGHGANQKNLSAEILKRVPIPIPRDPEEQAAIAAQLDAVATRVRAANDSLRATKALFSATLDALMSGTERLSTEAS